MNKKISTILKPFLYIMTNTAFLLLVANVNATCCGPSFQPELPQELNRFKRIK